MKGPYRRCFANGNTKDMLNEILGKPSIIDTEFKKDKILTMLKDIIIKKIESSLNDFKYLENCTISLTTPLNDLVKVF